ncbi:CopM family metallochaperone [Billgrantia kenyensis]|uniref:DUF305 domain-containing protein n=1 Tax=Billgrantia kenyensis TaxID=321266 RepID=A0A7V9W1Q9_9GAMM|nr:DUF305 domain-containing protein [Halomonas kenyensis]MBA2779434.1 DUF305 domain-containing protein [Halomonas kenyensis]MCG6662418.1 DUF305 domain-containing protein [Halomonas kenyensis]
MLHTYAVRPLPVLAFILAGSALLAAPVLAEEERADAEELIQQTDPEQASEPQQDADHHDHDHDHEMHEDDEHADNEAVQAYREVNQRMHEDMSIEFTGNPDADFALGMIPHHQGAIDMANVVLTHGEDEAIRDLAREIIEAQEEEIAFLRDWLAKHGYEEE